MPATFKYDLTELEIHIIAERAVTAYMTEVKSPLDWSVDDVVDMIRSLQSKTHSYSDAIGSLEEDIVTYIKQETDQYVNFKLMEHACNL